MADNNNTQHIVWHDDAIIKQLISYAVGCMLGRYRLDKPGLHIAHPNKTALSTGCSHPRRVPSRSSPTCIV